MPEKHAQRVAADVSGRSALNEAGGIQQVVIIEREKPEPAAEMLSSGRRDSTSVAQGDQRAAEASSSAAPRSEIKDRDLWLRGLVIAGVSLLALLLLVLLLRTQQPSFAGGMPYVLESGA